MAETFAKITTPVLEKMAESIKSVIEVTAEAKTAKEEFEAKSKSILERIEATEQKNAILEAEQLEMKAKKSVNVSGATQVVSYDKLSYEVKSDAVKFFAKSHDVISTEEYSKKCIEYIKSFCSNNQDFAKKYNIGAIVGDIESKSFHNTADFGYSTGLLNAPLVLDILVEVLQGSVIRQYATTRLSNSIKVEMPSFENIGEAEWVGPAQQRLQQQTVAFADLKSVTAAHAASPISLTQSLK